MDGNNYERNKRERTENPSSLGAGHSITPKPVSNENESNEIAALNKRLNSCEKWEFRFSFVIALAAIITATVAYYQLQTMSDQLKEMRGSGEQTDKLIVQVAEQAKAANQLAVIARNSLAESRKEFLRDQRPYIIPTIEPAPLVAVIEGAPIKANISLVNYGKSPAVKVSGYAAIFIGRDALKQADKWFAAEINQRFNTNYGATIPQGVPTGLNREKYTQISSRKSITGKDLAVIRQTDSSVVIVTRYLYFDSAGNSYGTDSCFRMLKTWEAAYCQEHNEIH